MGQFRDVEGSVFFGVEVLGPRNDPATTVVLSLVLDRRQVHIGTGEDFFDFMNSRNIFNNSQVV